MNRQQTETYRPYTGKEAVIYFRGKWHTVADAGEVALREQQQKHFQEAVDIYDRILVFHPGNPDVHNNRGIVLHAMKRYAEALVSFDIALKLRPGDANAHNNRGAALQQLKRFPEALASYDQSIALNPNFSNAHHNRGTTLQYLLRYDEALASCEKAIALKPQYANAHNSRGAALQLLKRYDDAQASFEQAIALNPGNPEFYNNLGLIWLSKGNIPEAGKFFRRALEIKPDYTASWYRLSGISKFQSVDNPDVKSIQALLKNPALSADDKEHLYFSLGKIYDDCSLYDEAFDAYQQGNLICKSCVSYTPEAVTSMTNSVIEVFNRDFLGGPFPYASDSRSPVFIVGMPRSGTTLMATILSNHRSIASAGELPTIGDFATLLPGMTETGIRYPGVVKHITPALGERLINEYERRLRRDFGPQVPHIVDKYPLNFWNLGFITMLFPRARIIHCRRHPLDTGLSNYFQRFGLQYNYSFDLRNIGHFYGEYARLMEHWRRALPVEIMELSYEDLIVNTEQTTRKALDFIGLEWDARCLAPHTNRAPVETASQWQVRQPIYRQSLERWRHYEKFLAAMKEMMLLAGVSLESCQ